MFKDFFDFFRFEKINTREYHTMVTLRINMFNSDRKQTENSNLAQRRVSVKKCDICGSELLDHVSYLCRSCRKSICFTCMESGENGYCQGCKR